jgi:hypothetical protein
MPDFVVDLDLSIELEWDLQMSVAVSARDREAAAMIGMLIVSQTQFDDRNGGRRIPHQVSVVAIENADAIDEGMYDEDWRGISVRTPDDASSH